MKSSRGIIAAPAGTFDRNFWHQRIVKTRHSPGQRTKVGAKRAVYVTSFFHQIIPCKRIAETKSPVR